MSSWGFCTATWPHIGLDLPSVARPTSVRRDFHSNELIDGDNVQFGATVIGLLAAVLTTLAFVPQVLKTWRSRSTHDISLGTFALLVVGITAWLVYGALIGDMPLILANGVTLVLAGTILFLKIRNG